MPVVTRIGNFRITRLSPSSADIYGHARAYLESLGHFKRQVGAETVFTVRKGSKVIHACGSLNEAIEYVKQQTGTEVPIMEDSLIPYLERHAAWSARTFGPGPRTKGILEHIRKELKEIEQDPGDLEEWIDVIILALDGYWRHWGNPLDLMRRLQEKQNKNFARQWPAWQPQDHPTEHIR
jgi:dATP/dGTP pyrophosphohydrolase